MTDLSPALSPAPDKPTKVQPAEPARRPAWLRVSTGAAVAVALVAGIGLATLLPSVGPAGPTPPVQPAAPPARPGTTAPAVDLLPRTAVGQVVAPAADHEPDAEPGKKNRKKGREGGRNAEDGESGDG